MKGLVSFYKNIILILLLVPIILLVCCLGFGGYAYLDMKIKAPPTIEEAPWVIQTYSQDGLMLPARFYYVAEVSIIRGQPVMYEYWALDDQRYKKHNSEKMLPANSRVIRRQ